MKDLDLKQIETAGQSKEKVVVEIEDYSTVQAERI
jgi:hypothetical protein